METKQTHFIGLAEAGLLLGVSRITVRELLRQRELPFFTILGQYKLEEADVLAYLERQRTKAKHEIQV